MPCIPCRVFVLDSLNEHTQTHTSLLRTTSALRHTLHSSHHSSLSLCYCCIAAESCITTARASPCHQQKGREESSSIAHACPAVTQEDHDSIGSIGGCGGCDNAGDQRRPCVHVVPPLASSLHESRLQRMVSKPVVRVPGQRFAAGRQDFVERCGPIFRCDSPNLTVSWKAPILDEYSGVCIVAATVASLVCRQVPRRAAFNSRPPDPVLHATDPRTKLRSSE